MGRRIFWTLAPLFLLVLFPLVANGQPVDGDSLTNGQLEKVSDPVQLWVADSSGENPVPDTFYVHEATDGQYWRSKINDGDGGYFYRCPVQGQVFNLSSTQSAFSAFSSGTQTVVTEGTIPSLPSVVKPAECIERFATTLDSLLSTVEGEPKSTTYADECRTNVDNGTVHVPSTANFSGGEAPEPGDTLAVYEPDGNCVGNRVWTESGATLAAAMTNETIEDNWPEWEGLSHGEPMIFEVYKSDENRVFRATPTFASCDTLEIPICRDENQSEDGAFFELAELAFVPFG